jgi:transcriptional regulator with XRE-family HTH domain
MRKRRARKHFTSWPQYVSYWIEDDERQVDVADRTGIDQTTISRWLAGERKSITSQSVAKFARGYGRPVIEAFVAAGFLSESEAGLQTSDMPDWRKITDAQLLAELQRRMRLRSLDGGDDAGQATDDDDAPHHATLG